MISKNEWEAATRELIAKGRENVGPPPTFEQVEALSRGELPEAEAERVREVLSHYPDMLRILAEPFPADAEGVLTEEQLAADLAKIRSRIRRTPPAAPIPPITFSQRRSSPRLMALAAGFAIALAIGSLAIWRLTSEPRATQTKVIFADGARGGTRGGLDQAPAQLSTATDYKLQLVLSARGPKPEGRIEFFDVSGDEPKHLWAREHVHQQADGTYPIDLPTDDLEPGLYRLMLFDASGTSEPLASYTLRLSRP
jgi:hypothetical protein